MESGDPFCDNLRSWIKHATRLNIKQLVLNLYSGNNSQLLRVFSCLIGCTTLSTLVVHCNCEADLYIRDEDNFCVPNLKRLEVSNLYFPGTSFYDMLCGFSVIEELVILSRCQIEGNLSITSPSLKKLKLEHCVVLKNLSFRVPNLEELKLSGMPCYEDTICEVTSLLRADIGVWSYPTGYTGISQLVTACRTTTSLRLSVDVIRGIIKSSVQLPVFQKLTCLSVGYLKSSRGSEILARLLQSAPHLQKLVLEKGYADETGGYEKFEFLLPNTPTCLELHLKEIEFGMWEEENEDEIKLMDYFLKNGKVLENLIIYCPPFKDWSGSCKFPWQPKVFYEPIHKLKEKI